MLIYVGRWLPTARTYSCSELFGAMKDEGSLHWCGNAAGNEIDRNKNHMLISHSTELQVKQVFPHPMQSTGSWVPLLHQKFRFSLTNKFYNTKQHQNKKQQKTVDNYIKYATFKFMGLLSKDPNQNKQLLIELVLKPCLLSLDPLAKFSQLVLWFANFHQDDRLLFI